MKSWDQVLKEWLVVLRVISLKFCTKSFENVHLTYENSTKPINKLKKTVNENVKQPVEFFVQYVKFKCR